MNKYELKYMLEQQTSILDRLSDTTGKQSLHIQELWEEIKQKDNRITKLTNKIYELHDIIKSQKQKNWEEFIHPERIDN
jgi:predicted RNase H-like nuclease (RuvC/YqgF family)|tara:strand:+ start:498 stop:734 length:237 start_codon:yes stop_codon:yes gene_type:complete